MGETVNSQHTRICQLTCDNKKLVKKKNRTAYPPIQIREINFSYPRYNNKEVNYDITNQYKTAYR